MTKKTNEEKKVKKPVKKAIKKPSNKPSKSVVKAPKKVVKPDVKPTDVPTEDAVAAFLQAALNASDAVVLDPDEVYQPETSVTGAPKNFMIRCGKCRWARLSSGVKADIADLNEIQPGCKTCGKWRKFHCKRCGQPAFMKRIKGNS